MNFRRIIAGGLLVLAGSSALVGCAADKESVPSPNVSASGLPSSGEDEFYATHLVQYAYQNGNLIFTGTKAVSPSFGWEGMRTVPIAISGIVFCSDGHVLQSNNLTDNKPYSVDDQFGGIAQPCKDGKIDEQDQERSVLLHKDLDIEVSDEEGLKLAYVVGLG